MLTLAPIQTRPRQKLTTPGRAETRPIAERPTGVFHDFSRTSIFPGPTGLTVGRPGDPCEGEADRVSERVMSVQPPSRSALNSRAGSTDMGRTPEPSAADELLRAPGEPLDAASRTFMESRFRFDFGRVRVHHDPAAERAASGLSARAFTLGPHIAFGEGQYAPETSQGQRLL